MMRRKKARFFIYLMFLSPILSLSPSPSRFAWAVPPQLPAIKPLNFAAPKAVRFELSNKAAVFFIEDHELPQIQMTAFIRGGTIYDPLDKIGLAEICASVWPYGGSQGLDPEEITKTLELMGSNITAQASEEAFNLSLFSLKHNFEKTLTLFSELVSQPRFDAKKLEVEKKLAIGEIACRNDEPRTIAVREFKRMLYGSQSPWGRRIEVNTVDNISRKDLLKLHAEYFRPANTFFAISGDISERELVEKLEQYLGSGAWKGQASELPILQGVQPETQRMVYLVNKPSAQQSAIRLGHFGVKRHAQDFFAIEVMNDILGGGYVSRLFSNVRSRKGLAYYVGTGYSTPADYGMMFARVGTKTETTVQAIEEVLREIQAMKDAPVSAEELSLAKNRLINSFVQNFNTTHQSVKYIAGLEFYGYPKDWLDNYQAKLAAVSAEDILRASTAYLKPERSIIVIVGDSKNFDKKFTTLGPVKILNPEDGSVRDYATQSSRR